MLRRKLLRDLWGQKGQLAALVVVQFLGVALYVGSYAGYLNLRQSYARTQRELALAQVQDEVTPLDERALQRAAVVPGVSRLLGRDVVSLPLTLERGHLLGGATARLTLDARVITLPDSGQPTLDRLHLLSGGLPRSPDGLVLEEHLARFHDLRVGDDVEVKLPDGSTRSLEVQGIAASAEYLWVSRDATDPMPSPDAFGVLWMRRSGLAELAKAYLSGAGNGVGSELAAAADGRFNQLLYDRLPGADPKQVDLAIDSAVGAGVVSHRTAAADLVGPRLLQLDVNGIKEMAVFFPVFFLGVAGFISLALLARVVDQQRQTLGTLRALGLSRTRVVLHLLAFGGTVGLASTVLGAGGGAALARVITRDYADELSIPFVAVAPHFGVIGAGLAIGLLTSLIAALVPSWHAAHIQPAEAMRSPSPSASALVRASRHLDLLPMSLRLPLRNALRHPMRALAAALGVVGALVLLIATVACAQSIQRLAEVELNDAQTYDVRVDLSRPIRVEDIRSRLDSESAVKQSELSLTWPVSVKGPAARRDLMVSAVAPDAQLLRPVDFEGNPMHPGDGILLPRTAAKELGLRAGDTVELTVALLDQTVSLKVNGIVETALGPVATMDLGRARALFGVGETANTVAATGPDRIALRTALDHLPGVASLFDAGAMRGQLDQLLALNISMIGVMLVFAIILGAAILSTMATLSILERARELATLRAMGMRVSTIGLLTTVENGLAGLLGLAVGLPLSHEASRRVVALFDSDLLALPFVWSWGIAIAAGVGVLAVLLLAQAPALRGMARLNLATTVRSREG